MSYDQELQYIEELQTEKESLHPSCVHAARLLALEIDRVQTGTNNRDKMLDLHTGKQQSLVTKVRLPVRDYPQVNFPGRLIGPKGIIMRQFQEKTGTRLSVFGRGSMTDKNKEEELRQVGGKFAHLNDELHVHLEVFAHPVECYRRMSIALHELISYLGPDEPGTLAPPNGAPGRGRMSVGAGPRTPGAGGLRAGAAVGGDSWSSEVISAPMTRSIRPSFHTLGGGRKTATNSYNPPGQLVSTTFGQFNAVEETEDDEFTAAPLESKDWYDDSLSLSAATAGGGGGGKLTSFPATSAGKFRSHPYQETGQTTAGVRGQRGKLY